MHSESGSRSSFYVDCHHQKAESTLLEVTESSGLSLITRSLPAQHHGVFSFLERSQTLGLPF